MKRFLSVLFATLLLSAVLCVYASASDFDAVAEDLSAIGMFRGTDNGFELDRVPTRSEAAIMLVRLYGAEEMAKAAYENGEISHPFTDVSAFTSPYVAWLYTNEITNGFTDTTYASQRACSAQNYVVFLLRALGYKDGIDFQYADALSFAQSKGFYNPEMFNGEFLRDDLAALTYQALAADMANGKTYLLDNLISDGAVNAKAAKSLTEKIQLYRSMTSAMATMDENAMDIDIDTKMNLTMSAAGETITSSADVSGNMKMITDSPDIQLAYSMKTTNNGVSTEINLWMKDGWMYFHTDDLAMVKYHMEDQAAALESIEPIDMDTLDVSGLAMLDSISSRKSGSNTIYTMVINQNLGGLDSLAEEETTASSFTPITVIYTVDYRGHLKSVEMTYSADMTMEMPLTDGSAEKIEVRSDYHIMMKINATGNKVKITWPDFSDASEIVGGNSWPVGL